MDSRAQSEEGSRSKDSIKKRTAMTLIHHETMSIAPQKRTKHSNRSGRPRAASAPTPRALAGSATEVMGAATALASLSGFSSEHSPAPFMLPNLETMSSDEVGLEVMRRSLRERQAYDRLNPEDRAEIQSLLAQIERILSRSTSRASGVRNDDTPDTSPLNLPRSFSSVPSFHHETSSSFRDYGNSGSTGFAPPPTQFHTPVRMTALSRRRSSATSFVVPGTGIDSPVSRRAHFLMTQLGMTQAQVAREISQHPSTISEFINGRRAESERVQNAGKIMMNHLETLYRERLFAEAVERRDV